MNTNFLSITVILPAKNVVETAKFYEEKLGFEIIGIWRNPEYSSVRRGHVIIEFGEGQKEHAGSGVCLIQVNNADELYSEFKSKQVEFIGDVSEQEYGKRNFKIKDNNGNILIICQTSKSQNEHILTDKIA